MESEITAKIQLIRDLLDKKGYDGVILNSQANLSWLTGGRFFINWATESGAASFWIGPESIKLITNNIEAERLWQEEGAASTCDELVPYPWYDEGQKKSLLARYSQGLHMATDELLSTPLRNLRMKLTEGEQERYAALGRMSSDVIESVAEEFKQGESEYQVAGRMAKACLERGIEPIVCLVGADERVFTRRHPLPTEKTIENYAMLVLGARCGGLVASVSRAVYFGNVPSELAAKQRAVNKVEAAYWASSRPGVNLGEVFRAGMDAYTRTGFPNEWQFHHQGGPAGYQSREIKVTSETPEIIEVGQALAWNPTIQGTKAEDTVLVLPNGLKNITASRKFPMESIVVDGITFECPLILER